MSDLPSKEAIEFASSGMRIGPISALSWLERLYAIDVAPLLERAKELEGYLEKELSFDAPAELVKERMKVVNITAERDRLKEELVSCFNARERLEAELAVDLAPLLTELAWLKQELERARQYMLRVNL